MKRLLIIAVATAMTVLGFVASGGPAQATYPGRNGSIAFMMDVGSGFQLYTVRPNGHNLRQITALEGDAVVPDWSRDGRRIVFEYDHPNGNGCSIDLINADGSGLVDLTGQRTGCEQNPSFTPDGRHIVFVAQRCDSCSQGIWNMNLHGRNRHMIQQTPTGLHAIDPNVSPDGSTLAFVAQKPNERGALYLVDTDGTDLRRIVPFSFSLGTRYDWAPDGKRLVFTTNGSETSNVATVRPDGSGLTYLTDSRSPDVSFGGAAYSPDGHSIVFRQVNQGESAYFRMRSNGGPLHLVIDLPMAVQNPGGVDWGRRALRFGPSNSYPIT
jgi:Tol biopolymer transport system component